MRNFFLLISFVFSALSLVAQDPPAPELVYVDVLPDNRTKLKWLPPSVDVIINDFPGLIPDRYYVYRANAIDGTYTLLDEILYDNDPAEPPIYYTDATADADVFEKFYYVELRYAGLAPNVAITSEIIASIHLELDGSPSAIQSIVSLNWNVDPITQGPSLQLQENVDGAGWGTIFVGNYSFDSFSKAVDHCHSPNPSISIDYRIVIIQASDTITHSNVVSGLFSDTTAPDDVEIETISVNNNNEVELCWAPSSAIDIGGYRFFTDGNIQVPPAIFDGSVTSRVFLNPPVVGQDPTDGPVGYFVVPFDDCIQPTTGEGNAGTYFVGITDFHETIFLEADYDVCSQIIELNWTPYSASRKIVS